MRDYLTVDETADLLRVSSSTIRRQLKAGNIPFRRVGNRIIIPRAALEAALDAGIPSMTTRPDTRRERRYYAQVNGVVYAYARPGAAESAAAGMLDKRLTQADARRLLRSGQARPGNVYLQSARKAVDRQRRTDCLERIQSGPLPTGAVDEPTPIN